jgi:opacity protein-like surface antigen
MWRFGGGVSYQLTTKNSLEMGYRFMHISNGKGYVENNPAINSQGGYIGWRLKF